MYNRDRLVIIMLSMLVFRIPLSRLIGDNGCGYLSGPFEVFLCLFLLFGAGLTITMRGMMHDRVRREQYYNALNVFILAKRYTFICAMVLLLICMAGYDLISTRLFADSGSRIAFLLVGPAVFLSLFVNLNIGYLSGTDNSHAAMIGEIIYAVSCGLCMLIGGGFGIHFGERIAALLRNEEVKAMYGAMGSMVGLCVGELLCLLVVMTMTLIAQRSFKQQIRSEAGRRPEHSSTISGRLLGGMLGDGLQELLLHLPIFISIFLFRKLGVSTVEEGSDIATIGAAVGAFYSKYIALVGIFALAATASVQGSLKGIAAAVNESDNQLAADRIVRVFARISYFAVPASIILTMIAPVLVQTVFAGRVTTPIQLLNMGSALIFIYAVSYGMISILIKLGYNREMLVVNAVALIIGTVVSAILMKKNNGSFAMAVIGMMIDYGLCLIVCVLILLRNFRIRFRLLQFFFIPLVVSGVLGLAVKLIGGALYGLIGGVLTLIVCIIPVWFIYNMACIFLHVASASQMSKKLFGPLFVRIGQNLGIY